MDDRGWRWVWGALALLLAVGALAWSARSPLSPRQTAFAGLPVLALDAAEGAAFAASDQPGAVMIWLPGCGLCRAEAPTWEAVRQRHAEDARFLAVSIVRDPRETRAGAAKMGVGGPLAVTTGNLLSALDVGSVPAMAFVDRQGTVVAVAEGALDEATIEAALASLR